MLAALASYTALDLADRVIKTARPLSRRVWLTAGAFVMGIGIWSMHFTGMLAFDTAAPMSYDAYVTVLSALVAVAASAVALFAVSRPAMNLRLLLAGGATMGAGIVSMHYIGMAAMRMPAQISYYPPLVALSVAIAVGASLGALRLASRFSREGGASPWLKGGGGLLMGAAIAGMHYTGMAAARFSPDGSPPNGAPTVDNLILGGSIGAAALVILGVALAGSMVDRRLAAQAERLAESGQLYTSLFEQSVDAIFIHDDRGWIFDCNSEAWRSLGYTREELLSLNVADFATNLASGEETLWQRALDTEPGRLAGVHEGEHVRKDGARFPVEVRVGGVDYGGERAMFAAATDITERKRAEEEAADQLRREALRAGVGEALNSSGSLSEMLRLCADAMVGRVQEVCHARIWTFDEGRDELTLEANSGDGAEPPPVRMSNSIIAREVARTYEPFVENDVRSNERLLTRNWARSAGVNAIAGYPLVVEGRLVGLVTTLSSEPFAPRVVEAVQAMTGPIAQGIRRKWAERELRASEARLRAVMSGAPVVLFAVDADGVFTLVEGRSLEPLRVAPAELVGRSVFEAYGDSPEVLGNVRRALAGEEVAATVEVEGMAFDARYSPLRGPGGETEGAIGVATDVSARRELEKEMEHRAFHDPLTELPNRALFTERLEQALPRAARGGKALAVLFLDLDNFKFINDSLSHEVGDALLVEISSRIRSCLRRTDTAARFGGDEFTVLVERISGESGAVRVAGRIADALREPFDIGGREVFVTFSIGIAVSLDGGEKPEELLRDADTAMYRAKSGGKARYEIFDQSMNTRALQRLELESDLRRAVDNGEITVHYQPVVGVEDGLIRGVEALARWEHPRRGLVPPSEFIPVAEETGLIVPLGRAVLDEACRQTESWRRISPSGSPLAVGVNLSARQFGEAGLVEDVSRALRQSGLAPQALKLEITESVMLEDTDSNAGVLQRLRELGVRLAVDDFGKGYSSLAYLKRLPLDLLKIDRSFVGGIDDEAGDMAIVSAVITFARTLGLTVIAEGVENAGQLASLRELGCDLAQGYYLARPMPPGELEELLRAGKPLADPQAAEGTGAFGHFAENHRAAEKSRTINRAVAASSDCIVITDPNQPDNPMIYVNRSFERLTGYTAGEAIGRNCRFLQGDDADQPALDDLRAALAAGKEWTGVVRNYRKDGALFYNELSISPVRDENGRLISYIGVQNDVSSLVRERGEPREPVRYGADRGADRAGW